VAKGFFFFYQGKGRRNMAELLEKLCGKISLSEGQRIGITITTEGEIQEVLAQGALEVFDR
jgi:predicted DNA-binding antitoxin AbrB/MazE fold protein